LIIFSSQLKTNELFRKIVKNMQLAELAAFAARPELADLVRHRY
jgi:hypothetical protein